MSSYERSAVEINREYWEKRRGGKNWIAHITGLAGQSGKVEGLSGRGRSH